MADVATTVVGLAIAPRVSEQNVVARQVLASVGLAGIVVAGLVSVAIVAMCVEWCVRLAGFDDPENAHGRLLLYAGSYYPLAVVSLGAALHNVSVIQSVV